jgi:UV DNA damage repair endonuclease
MHEKKSFRKKTKQLNEDVKHMLAAKNDEEARI